jgi:hypothetical protein
MSGELGSYSFLPWLRSGLANRITTLDGDHGVALRARIDVDVDVTGALLGGGTRTERVHRELGLVGPGDVVGLDAAAIVRMEPRDWITNAEPSYLPTVEFYDEDLPWRHTPAAPDPETGRLRPWIALVVLEETEFTPGATSQDRPLGVIDVTDASVLPPADELWAWAHVQVNASLAANDGEIASDDTAAVLARVRALLAADPDVACSRLVSPRKLAPNAAYHAFVVPVFESGRLAGLGLDPEASPDATHSAWEDYPGRLEPASLPYYARWFFRTGATGDFESLVRALRPRPVDIAVGRRDLDVRAPGSGVPRLQEQDGVLKLGGALRVPRARFTDEEWAQAQLQEAWDEPFPRPFQEALARLVDLADDAAAEGDPDPLVTPPLYGTWHALARRLLFERGGAPLADTAGWVHGLNLDPRHRVAAGLGARVVQAGQEDYMDAAWEQIGRVLEANRRVRLGQLAREVSHAWFAGQLRPVAQAGAQGILSITAPVHARVLVEGQAVRHRMTGSTVAPTLVSVAMRRAARPGGRLVRSLPFGARAPLGALLRRVSDGDVSAAPPKVVPPGVVTLDELAEEIEAGVPAPVRRAPWLVRLVIALLVALAIALAGRGRLGRVVAALALAAAAAVWRVTRGWMPQVRAADAIAEEAHTAASVEQLPVHTAEERRTRDALAEAYGVLEVAAEAGAPVTREPLRVDATAEHVLASIDPRVTIPARIGATLHLPDGIRAEVGEGLVEAMAYPVIDAPMYAPLRDLSSELLLPNIGRIEPDSITLLETNRAFIEAYMAGLNHEMARELLWREYPTDQRGSPFRQFWDVRSYLAGADEAADPEALRERLRDIPPLDRWVPSADLGTQGGDTTERLVLTIRGELLKRYPNAVIHAHRACWQRAGSDAEPDPCRRTGAIDPGRERRLVALSAADELDPPRTLVRTPLFEARVDPDITFLGFDLTGDEAKGGTGERPTDDPGWFFVIKERPGDPRFGLDIERDGSLSVWNDLAWPDVQAGPPGSPIRVGGPSPAPALSPPTLPEDDEKVAQHGEDVAVRWRADMGAADLAYILFQAPVLVAVHASEMLGEA